MLLDSCSNGLWTLIHQFFKPTCGKGGNREEGERPFVNERALKSTTTTTCLKPCELHENWCIFKTDVRTKVQAIFIAQKVKQHVILGASWFENYELHYENMNERHKQFLSIFKSFLTFKITKTIIKSPHWFCTLEKR